MNSNKWIPLLILIGMACVGLGAYSIFHKPDIQTIGASNLTSNSEQFMLPADRAGWQPIGTGSFILEIRGTIEYGGYEATPDTSHNMCDDTCLVATAAVGTVVGKIGETGRPFKVGSVYKFNTSETVYIAVNDSKYSDNSGSYMVTKINK
jgi:hypothetical protein